MSGYTLTFRQQNLPHTYWYDFILLLYYFSVLVLFDSTLKLGTLPVPLNICFVTVSFNSTLKRRSLNL